MDIWAPSTFLFLFNADGYIERKISLLLKRNRRKATAFASIRLETKIKLPERFALAWKETQHPSNQDVSFLPPFPIEITGGLQYQNNYYIPFIKLTHWDFYLNVENLNLAMVMDAHKIFGRGGPMVPSSYINADKGRGDERIIATTWRGFWYLTKCSLPLIIKEK